MMLRKFFLLTEDFIEKTRHKKQFEDENDNMQNMFITDSGLQSSATVPK